MLTLVIHRRTLRFIFTLLHAVRRANPITVLSTSPSVNSKDLSNQLTHGQEPAREVSLLIRLSMNLKTLRVFKSSSEVET